MKKNNSKISKKQATIFISIAVLVIATIATLGTFVGIFVHRDGLWKNNAENIYQQTYYNLVDSAVNVETNLAKMKVARASSMQQELFVQLALEAQICVVSLEGFSFGEYDMSSLIKFYNQVGDFCQYGQKKLAWGNRLMEKDYEILEQMFSTSSTVGKRLTSLRDKRETMNFMTKLGELNSDLVEIMQGLNDGTFQYPSMIYDGPFSDGLDKKDAKFLEGKEDIDAKDAKLYIEQAMPEYEIAKVEYISSNKSHFDSHLLSFTTKDKKEGSIQISAKGGFPVMWDIQTHSKSPQLSQEEGVEKANEYCKKIHMDDMQPVWSCVKDSVLYVNLCFVKNNIIIYPDMVKVKVSLDSGSIVGFESLNYIYNHTNSRSDMSPIISEDEAKLVDCGKMEIASCRLTIIPFPSQERLCYELFGELDGTKFFIYVDAKTGKQIKILEVIDSDEGSLLL